MFKTLLIALIILVINTGQYAFANQDFGEIKRQAQLANDTYLDVNQIQATLQQQGQALIHKNTLETSQVSYFLSKHANTQTIAIRGTANVENVMLDLDIQLQPDSQLNIPLHRGFSAGAKAVFQDVKPYLLTNTPIKLTGHSLGGSIAVVLAMYLQLEGYQVPQVITFGQPKVTNAAGAKQFSELPLIRVVTPLVIVPLVPPLSPMQIKNLDIYWHHGEEVILMGNHKFAQTSGLKSMLRATKFTSAIPSEKNLIAHNMGTYLGLIDQLIISAEQVPYKTQINLFGFSLD